MSEGQAIVLFNTVVARIVVLSKNGDVTYLPNFEETTNDSTLQASTLYNQNYWTACCKLQQYIGKFGYHICVHSYRKLASPSLIRFTTARLYCTQYILCSWPLLLCYCILHAKWFQSHVKLRQLLMLPRFTTKIFLLC